MILMNGMGRAPARRQRHGQMRGLGFQPLITPGTIAAEMDALYAAIESMNKDVTAQLLATGKETLWVNRWRDFRREFLSWYEKNHGLWGRLWGSTYDEAEGFRRRFESWRDEFQTKVGGKVTGPKLPPPAVPPPGDSTDIFTWIKRIVLVGGVAVGLLYLAPHLVPQVARTVGAIRKARHT